ncbi:MAG: hypothetical protein IPL83_05520 [Bdellovibrionales bacterium]|nr:hypothetical protein [Bdellovibrionales bacterium]
MIQRLASKPSVNLLCPRHLELAELNLRSSGSSSVWCSAHNGSAAAGRMFEDPEIQRFDSARYPWSLEQQSVRPVCIKLSQSYAPSGNSPIEGQIPEKYIKFMEYCSEMRSDEIEKASFHFNWDFFCLSSGLRCCI